jgi:hypothetical protein
MKLTVDARQLTEENKQQRELARVTVKELWAKVREVSLAVERRVKTAMPVDTGRARASWGHWSPGDLRASNAAASAGDAHWKENEGGLELEQGSNVEYIDDLNDGHSSQAPKGFLDSAAEHGQKVLDQKIDDIIDRYW